MKSEKEIREMVDKLIMAAVESVSEADEDSYLQQATTLGWVVGISMYDIRQDFDDAMEARYVEV